MERAEACILAAPQSVQSETERRTLERAIKVCGAIASRQEPQPLRNVGIECMTAIQALIDKPAASDPMLVALARWRHVKRGTVYTEIGRGTFQLASDSSILDEEAIVIYRGDDGQLWARPVIEFEDGRFERVALAEGDR